MLFYIQIKPSPKIKPSPQKWVRFQTFCIQTTEGTSKERAKVQVYTEVTGLGRKDRKRKKENSVFLDPMGVLPLEGNLKHVSIRIFPLACGTLAVPDLDSEEKYIHY